MLTIGHANVKGRRQGVRVLRRRGCDSIGVNEGWRLVTWLLAVVGYRIVVATGQANHRSAETPTLVRRKLHALGAIALEVSRASWPDKVAGLPRWATVAAYDHPDVGPVAHINLHMHWIGPAHDQPDVDRVQEYDRASGAVVRLIRLFRWLGWAVVVTGDLNVPEGVRTPGWLDAWEAFDLAGLTSRTVGRLDGVAWDATRLQLVDLDTISAKRLGSDHPGLIARFRKAQP